MLNNNSTSAFYRPVNLKFNATRGLAPLHNGAKLFINDADKDCAFNNVFSSIFSPPNLVPPPTNLASTHTSDEVDYSPATVFAALYEAKHTLSDGYNIAPSIFWTKLRLYLLFLYQCFLHHLKNFLFYPLTGSTHLLCRRIKREL